MHQARFVGVRSLLGLCAVVAFGAIGCDQSAEGRADSLVDPGSNDPCDGLAERVAECAEDQDCELEALEAEFATCTASGKADGPIEFIEEQIDNLKQSLLDRAQRCYDDRDAGCLWWTYWSLAAGAKLRSAAFASADTAVGSGTLTLHYKTLEQLDDICRRLAVGGDGL